MNHNLKLSSNFFTVDSSNLDGISLNDNLTFLILLVKVCFEIFLVFFGNIYEFSFVLSLIHPNNSCLRWFYIINMIHWVLIKLELLVIEFINFVRKSSQDHLFLLNWNLLLLDDNLVWHYSPEFSLNFSFNISLIEFRIIFTEI
jgi:hypothetical protein